MNAQSQEASSQTILRLAEVLRRTGLSRSTLYLRIANASFPHQISLGGRAIGWLKSEVDDWVDTRANLRKPSTDKATSITGKLESATDADRESNPSRANQTRKPAHSSDLVNEHPLDFGQLSLVSTAIYFDKSSRSFWLKLIAEGSSDRKR